MNGLLTWTGIRERVEERRKDRRDSRNRGE